MTKFPDRLFPGFPHLDQFYYIKGIGKTTDFTTDYHQKYDMQTKLNDKGLKIIQDSGIKSSELGMRTPHCVSLVDVKKEFTEIADVEQGIKDLQTLFKLSRFGVNLE